MVIYIRGTRVIGIDRVLGNRYDGSGYKAERVIQRPTAEAEAWKEKWHKVTGLQFYENRINTIRWMLERGERLYKFLNTLIEEEK